MLNFETFKRYLHSPSSLRSVSFSYIGETGQYLTKWSVSLGRKSEEVQCQEVERLLAQMSLADINDAQRLDLMAQLYPVIRNLISRLHQHYLFESLMVSEQQLQYVNQIKSIYYLSILVFQGIVNRAVEKTNNNLSTEPVKLTIKKPKLGRFKQLLSSKSADNNVLQGALYALGGVYLNLLKEQALLYEPVPSIYWQQLNNNYCIALKYNCNNELVDENLRTDQADTIDAFYRQACLLSLLRLNGYRRQDIISLFKVLNTWAEYAELKHDATERLKIFVNLKAQQPPQYLTSATEINPYDDKYPCLFIDLRRFEQYLQGVVTYTRRGDDLNNHLKNHLKNDLNNNLKDNLSSQLEVDEGDNYTSQILQTNSLDSNRLARLADLALHRLQYGQEQRKTFKDSAVITSGFKLIHYYLAGRSSFFNIINQPELQKPHQPKYNTKPKTYSSEHQIKVAITEAGRTTCRLRWEYEPQHKSLPEYPNIQVQSLIAIKRNRSDGNQDLHTANTEDASIGSIGILRQNAWEIGVVSSVDIRGSTIDAVVRIIGTSATACGIRVDNKDGRPQDFVPALLLAANEQLATQSSLLVAKYHFKVTDKVVLRIGSKEAQLKLQEIMLGTVDFEQYSMVRIKSH